jgi:molecular chaperone DnaK
MVPDNTSLGQFNLVGIPPAPRGVPQIEVTFDIDANGILNVSAKDLGTGREQKITITASTKLSKNEIEKMMKAAEENAEADRRKKEEIEVVNNADSLVYQTEKFMTDYAAKVSSEQKAKIDDAVKTLKDAIQKKNIEEIKKKTEELSKAAQEVGASMYQQAQGAQQQSAGGPGGAAQEGQENVVDAEYKVEDDKKQ